MDNRWTLRVAVQPTDRENSMYGIRVCQSREIDRSNFSTSCNAPTKLILSLTYSRSNCATCVCVYA